MKKEIVINIKNDSKIIYYKEEKNIECKLNKNIKRIIKEIFDISDDIEIKEKDHVNTVLRKDEKICHFFIKKNIKTNKYILKILKDDIVYEYLMTIEKEEITGSLTKIEIENQELKGYILRYDEKQIICINKNGKEICIEIEDDINDKKSLIDLFYKINIDDKLNEIYYQITENNIIENIKIKKSIILDTNYFQEIITDKLYVENGIVVDYKTTIFKNNKTYVIEKNMHECTIKTFDSSIEALSYIFFELNDQINFIKKLERKKEN